MATKLDKLNAMLEEGVVDDLDLDFDDEEQEAPAEEVVKDEEPREDDTYVHPFISDTFSDLMKNVKAQEELEQEPKKKSIPTKDILRNIKVDLSNIKLSKGSTDIELTKNKREVLGASSVMQVVCCQSAYSAEVSALRNQEIVNINNLNTDMYSYKRHLYKTIWNHMEDTSVGKMDFNTWMKVTSFFDVETLLYGVYCQTFSERSEFPFQCNNADCGHKFNAALDTNTLLETRGDGEIFAKIDEIISNVNKADELLQHSHVHTTDRLMLDDSKIIVDIQIPSVYDYLEGILLKVRDKERFAEENAESLGMAMFIKQLFIPNITEFENTGELTFIQVDDPTKFVDIIAQLSFHDGNTLRKEVEDFSGKLVIRYSIKKGLKCPKCGYEFPEYPLDMERLLFDAIRRG